MLARLFIRYIMTDLYKFKGGGDEYEEINSMDFNKQNKMDSILECAKKGAER